MLSAVSRADWSDDAFPWLSVRRAFVGIAPAVIMSVSYSGALAYEIHVPNAQLYAAYLALRAAGKAHGLRLFGARAIESMRLEKGYLHWKADLITEFDPFETGLGRFVRMEKDFVGKSALIKRCAHGPVRRLVTLEIACDRGPALPGASVMSGGDVVGTVTSGAWGYRVERNLALAFVRADVALPGAEYLLDHVGRMVPVRVVPTDQFGSKSTSECTKTDR